MTEPSPLPPNTPSHTEACGLVHDVLERSWNTAQTVFKDVATPAHAFAIAQLVFDEIAGQRHASKPDGFAAIFETVFAKLAEVGSHPLPSASPKPQ